LVSVAANQADAVTVAHLFARARHRSLEEAELALDPRAKRRDSVRIAR
jgi:hypothetical protein